MKIFKSLIIACSLVVPATSFAGYTLPKYEKYQMDNGLNVYLMEQKEVPLVDVKVVVKAGALTDGNKAGLNYFTAANLSLGTEKLDKKALDESLDFIGANVYSTANVEFSTVSASFAKKDSELVLNTLGDIVLKPRFDNEEFNKFKKRHLLSLEQAKESPKSVINNYFNQLIFKGNGYNAIVRGDRNSVDALSIEQLKAHYSKWYQPKNAAVVVVGDFESAAMKRKLKQLFAGWQNTGEAVQKSVVAAKAASQANVLLVNKADASESTFLIGGKGIAQDNPDRVGLSVINTILGGRFTSWLNDELRVNAGLTYGARSRFSSFSNDGSFAISTFTRSETTVEAIDLALETYNRLWKKGIDKATLDSAKAYVKGQFPPKFETSSDLAHLLANMYGYQFDESYINTFESQVDSLTVKKASKLVNKYFPKDNLQFVVIGKSSEIKEKLAKYGEISEVNIKDVGFNTK